MKHLSDCTILVVDDTEANVDILVEALGDDYDVCVAMDGESALEAIVEEPPDLVLLDVVMPGMDGYQVCERLKASEATRDIPVVFLTSLTEAEDEAHGLELGAVDYITKPFNAALVKSRVTNHLELKRHRDHLQELVEERTREVVLTQEVTIECMAVLAECRDPETGGHIQRTQNYVRLLALALREYPRFRESLTDEVIELLYKSAPLHDIGKVGVPDCILLKPGKLTDAEFEEMKKHALYGRDAIAASEKRLGSSSFLRYAKEIAETHHEKWDGSGYPYGLKGEDIPVSGRLMAIADVYDALISKRCYKPPFPHTKASGIIGEGSGRHFDPDVVDAFLRIQEDFKGTALQFADSEEEREVLVS